MQSRPACSSAGPLAALIVLIVVAGSASCASRQPPRLEPLRVATSRVPVVVIPGISGTQLREAGGGAVRWGDGSSFFFPRDGGYTIALPLGEGTLDHLEPFAAIETLRLFGLVRVDFYASLVELFAANGYTRGNLDAPRDGEDFFLFPYDWRRGNVEAAAQLAAALERLRVARGEPQLRVNLICQSNAATIARYFVKYGGARLEHAETGRALPPSQVQVEKLILVGSANGGALRTLADLNRGRRYVPWIGRRFRPETLFTFPSLIEALPLLDDATLMNERGDSLDVTLAEPAAWERFGWSVFDPRVSRRIARSARDDLFGDTDTRRRHLTAALDRAVRLQELLARDVAGFGSTRYYAMQSAFEPTAERLLLRRRRGRWVLGWPEQRVVRRDPYLLARAVAPGDRHATLSSQRRLSPQELAALEPTFYVQAVHRKIILHPAVHHRLLEILAE